MEQELKNKFEADYYAIVGTYPDHCVLEYMHSAYTLAKSEDAERIKELEYQLKTQNKHKESIKGYWLSCAENKKKWEDAIKEYLDSEHPESIQTFEDFKEQFDLD